MAVPPDSNQYPAVGGMPEQPESLGPASTARQLPPNFPRFGQSSPATPPDFDHSPNPHSVSPAPDPTSHPATGREVARYEQVVIEGKAHLVKVRPESTPAPSAAPVITDFIDLCLNLFALAVPTLVVLLLSPWGGVDTQVLFDSFFAYLGLALGLTILLVAADQLAQVLTRRLLPDSWAAWVIEQVVAAIAVALPLAFFTASILGALLLSLIIVSLTVALSVVLDRLFKPAK